MAQLGGLISLIQGIDLAPMKLAQDRVLQQSQLAIQDRTARAQEELEKRRLDLAAANAKDNMSLERDRLGLGREQLTASTKQAEEQRSLDRELATAQQAGRIDLQELVGAQELAHINLQGQLSQTQQAERQQFEAEQQEKLFAFQGENLTKELNLRSSQFEREFTLAKQRGDDASAQAALDRKESALRIAIAERQERQAPSDQEAKDRNALEMELAKTTLQRSRYELEKINPNSPAVKALQEAELRLTEATARKVEAEAKTEEQVGKAQGMQLDKLAKGETETKGGTPVGEIDKSIKRLQDKVERGSSPVYGITGNQAALKALEQLKDLEGIEGEDYDILRTKLKRAAELAEKGGKSKVSKYPFVSDARIIGKDLSKAEIDELETLIDELYAEGIYIGYAD